MYANAEISWTEFPSESCASCALNVTEIHAINPICVHCSRVRFVKKDLFMEMKMDNDVKVFIEESVQNELVRRDPLTLTRNVSCREKLEE